LPALWDQIFQAHDTHVWSYAGNAFAITSFCTDDPSNMSAVTVVVSEIAIVTYEIPPMNIIDESISIIIDAIVRFVFAFGSLPLSPGFTQMLVARSS